MDLEDTNPAPDFSLPKQLTDLPDEVISQICEYLIPARSTPNPFKNSEIKSTRRVLKVGGWDNFGFISGNEPCTQQYVDSHFASLHVSGKPGRVDFRALTQPFKARKKVKTDLANFTATCRQFSGQGRAMYARRPFTLTISNHGITFESLRDAFPLQTFSVLPKDQGSVQPSWAMIDPPHRMIVKIPKNTIPGNIAFERFSAVFPNLRTLCMYVNVDLEKGHNKKTGFFLSQLGRFLLSHSPGIALSKLEVDLNLGFHEYVREDPQKSIGLVYKIPSSIRTLSRDALAQNSTIAKIIVPEVSDTLAILYAYLQQLLAKHNGGRSADAVDSGTERLKVKISVHGDGTDGMQWGTDAVVGMMWQVGAYRPMRTPFGSFEDFCQDLQHRLFGSNQVVENRVVDGVRFVCELGLPLPKIPKPTAKKGAKSRRRTRDDNASTGDVDATESKRQRLG
ncbi:hypothetical protein H2200_005490 [Cladophialophora chaetospira]|uniref:Uncharacterized protein n=1 Tax=Cladophialophora chaetospira TaxID=386627 RepID=A0AA38XC32_9EURO|nr:hypothetical protein H2200_005490 [Cladophialophora chaetospira]